MSGAIIRAEGLSRRFGQFTAVDSLSVHVRRGSIFAFLGANGSGKSTTIRMLIGLLRPSAGQIEVDGVDVIRHPRRVRDRIGYMGQKVSLYHGLTLRENAEFYGGLYGLSPRELDRRWGELAERFGLSDAEDADAAEVSAGIRQRAGLALATLHRPRLLFLDEPTAGVDLHSRNVFWDAIREQADAGVTVFVTTHFLEEAEYCDHAALIDRGRLVADAAPEELRRRYRDAYRVEIDISPAERPAYAAALERLDATDIGERAAGLSFAVRRLSAGLLSFLARSPGGEAVRITPLPMTEVFRRLLAESAEAREREAA